MLKAGCSIIQLAALSLQHLVADGRQLRQRFANERATRTPPSPGAFEGVRALNDAFDGQTWLVSKAGTNVQQKTKMWLRHWDFYDQTGLSRGNLRFCLKRHEKAHHCRQLKITHFIDDRLDVLQHLRDLVPHLYLFGEQEDTNGAGDWTTHVAHWTDTVPAVLGDLSPATANA